MSEHFETTIADADVMRLFDRLESSATNEAINGALRKAAEVVHRNAQSALVRSFPGESRSRGVGAFADDGAPVDNIRYFVDERKRLANINIWRDQRLWWFEGGTVERTTRLKPGRLPANRGRIPASHFFTGSYAASKEEAMNGILQSLDNYFNSLDR